MRVTVLEEDPGYDPMLDICETGIWFDGALHHGVITADTDEGTVLVYACNAIGMMLIDPNTGEPERKTLHGKVRIERWRCGETRPTIAETKPAFDLNAHLRF